MPRIEELESLADTWERDAEVLDRWDLSRKAEVVRVCCSDLEQQIANRATDRAGELIDTWETEAEVLAEYGHGDEAEVIRICVDRLRSLLAESRAESEGAGESESRAPEGDGPAAHAPPTNELPSESGRLSYRADADRPPSQPTEPSPSGGEGRNRESGR